MSHAFLPNVGSSRVENIKKRFETNTSSSGSDSVSPRNSPERCAPPVAMRNPSPAEAGRSCAAKKASPTIRNTISNLSQSPNRLNGKGRTTSPARSPVVFDRQLSSSRGSNVKRSPAFRCDKIVKGRNVVGNSRLNNGERPRSYLDRSSDNLGNNGNVKRFNSSPTKPTEPVSKRRASPGDHQSDPFTTDELSSVFSQRNLKPSDKPNPNLKPEILQKPQINVGISPKLERLSPSRPTNTNPNNPQLTKPPISTNRPAEYAVVTKRATLADARETHPNATKSDSDRPKPLVRLRPRTSNKPAVDFYSKTSISTTEQSPIVLSSGTKDLITTKSAQFVDVSVQDSETSNLRFTIGEQTNNTTGVPERDDAVFAETLREDGPNREEAIVQDVVRLQLTNTLKKALSSPLPAGPPPKKPPRTFAHVGPGIAPMDRQTVSERIQRLNDTGEEQPTPPNSVSLKNDLQSKSNLRPTTERTTQTPVTGVYGKTRKPPVGPNTAFVANNNTSLNNGPAGRNEMRSIKNVFPTRKSTENLLAMSRNDLGPKKPSNLESTSPQNRSMSKPVRSRTESEIMLKKLENVLQSRQNGGVASRPKSPGSTGPRDREGPVAVVRPLPRVPRDRIADDNVNVKRFGGCLESINCVGSDPVYARSSDFYEKPEGGNSEFFVSASYADLDRSDRSGELRKSSSAEHIYAEPFEFLREATAHSLGSSRGPRFNGDRVPVLAVTGDKVVAIGHFRDPSPPAGEATNATPDALHYLCTPVGAPAPMASDASANQSDRPDADGGEEPTRKVPALLRLAALVGGGGDSTDDAQPLNQNKIQYLMNQAFSLAALPLDGSDSDTPNTPEEPTAPLGPNFGTRHQGASLAATNAGEADSSERDLSHLTERRKRYVRKVSCLAAPRTSRDCPHLFRYLLLVGLTLHPDRKACRPYVKWKYPPDAEVTPHIEDLCFPDAADWPRPATTNEQSYSLVITDERGERTFGYCRRVMPEGMDVCLPLAYCIISPVRAVGFYYKVLSELESRHGQPEILLTAFISELYNSRVPGPGQALKPSTFPVSVVDNPDAAVKTGLKHSRTIVRRPLDLRLEERDLTQLFSSLCVPSLMQVFSSLLLERKVILFSGSLGKLSSCVEALQSILYPFSWQHTFIPVLPSSQLELCDAPTPYIFGVLKDKDGRPPLVSITDGIAVDLDTGQLVSKEGDESTILPQRLKRCLKMALQLVSATTQPGDAARNVLVSEAFIRAFVEVCGHYQGHVVTRPDGARAFEREAFVRAAGEPATRQFLEWFTETAMFRAFIDARVEGGGRARGMFERRAAEHSENTAVFLKNSRLVNTRLKSLGDRFKDWTPFT